MSSANITPPDAYAAGNGGFGPQSIAGIERVVASALASGFAKLQANPQFVDRAFRLYKADERERIKSLLRIRPPKILHGYPRSNAELPSLAVMVTNERESKAFLDDFIGENDTDPETDPDEFSLLGEEPATIKGETDSTSIDIWILDNNPDVVQTYYTLAWAILVSARKAVFHPLDATMGALSGGDVAPDPSYMPELCFVRRIGVDFTGNRTIALGDDFWEGVQVSITFKNS